MHIRRIISKLIKFIKIKKHSVSLNKTPPTSKIFGLERGTAIDRYYIEQFLNENRELIQGKVLEIAESTYSKKFGHNITSFEVLHYDFSNINATIIGDLTITGSLPENTIDCFVCTQTLNFIFDLKEAVEGCYAVLKENGVFLGTVAGISQISRYDMDRWGDYWRFTDLSIKKMFEEVFEEGNVEVTTFGNAKTSIAFLDGLSLEEIPNRILDIRDIDYQLIIGIKAIKKIEKI